MPEETDFSASFLRLRSGDDAAVRDFISRYEPFIRRSLRRRLVRANLQAAADSVDLCQSVLGSFLIRAAAGEYKIDTEDDLRKLLTAIAKNKFAALVRRESTQKRDRSRVMDIHDSGLLTADSASDPRRRVADEDLLQEVERRLQPEERKLLIWRRAGYSWDDIAARLGSTAVVQRKRLSRGLQRVAVELGLESEHG